MKKNDKVIGECIDYTHEGLGVVKIDGFALFVKNMCIGDKGEIVVTLVKKSHGYGRLLSLIESSDERVEPLCSIYKQCGGCQIQHLKYEKQLSFKQRHVESVIKRIGKIDAKVLDIKGMEFPYHYRNKVQIPFGKDKNGKLVSGFYRQNTNEIIDLNTCYIQSDLSNEVYLDTKSFIQKHYMDQVRHVLIKHGFHTGQIMVVLIVRDLSLKHINEYVAYITEKYECVKSIILNLNTREDNVILGEKEKVVFGTKTIEDRLMGFTFNISSKSFYQVNPIQTKVLYETAIEFAQLKPEDTLVDLYCGIGTIGMCMSLYVKKVIGIEVVSQAVEDAKVNAKKNNISNIEFMCGDASQQANKILASKQKIDVVVVDPPRKGCDLNTIETIVKMNPSRIVYVSCDPATLARDLSLFKDRGYETIKIQPVDMFAHSVHVENVVLLHRI